MKKLILSVLMAAAVVLQARADEGMWLPSLVKQRIGDMQAKGFKLSAEDIYSINKASLKDAVVLFGRGCTGELISSKGLLLTNHHCGAGQIQAHSSVEHDYLKDGFWAMSQAEELANPGLTVSFLEYMEDVTNQVLKGYKSTMTEEERVALVNKNSEKIIKKATAEGNGLRATVEALFYGNQYFIFVYREYKDVRLVAAPPTSIGSFGGDTDNWMWPRHTGDFSIFRIYADKDNNPAAYSPDNVPYTPKKHFKVSTKGVNEGDFTFIYGFPGKTQEYIHSEAVRYIAQVSDPHKINLRTKRLDVQNKYMDQSQAVRIQYSAKNANVANAWKKWQGEAKGINKMKTVATKQAFEKEFDVWAKGTEYEGVVGKLAALYAELEPYNFASDYYSETVRTIELASIANSVARIYSAKEFKPEALKSVLASFYKDYYLPIDKESFIAVMDVYEQNVSDDFKPAYYKEQMAKYGSATAWAEDMFANSIYADKTLAEALSAQDKDMVLSDPAYVFINEFTKWYNADVMPKGQELTQQLQLLYRDYMRGQMEFRKDKQFYPDANLTLRVAYGSVKGYSPSDAVYYYPYSSLKGVMEKDNPNIFDYDIPQRLRDIYATKDYGRWVNQNGEVPVCFLATNHTTGGNSGSPVINADGNLIGINFDRVWEGTMSDIAFDPDFCRNIATDIRYILFVIEKVGGAGYLIEEMDLAE